MPTYQTRRLTARDQLLLDRLAADPRYARVAAQLRPPPPKPTPQKPAKAADASSGPAVPAGPEPASTGPEKGAEGQVLSKPKPHPKHSDR